MRYDLWIGRVFAFAIWAAAHFCAATALAADLPAPSFGTPPPPDNDSTNIERLKRELAVDPNSAASWVALGWRLYTKGRFGEAQWALEQARALNPNDPYVLWLSGLTNYVMGDYKNAHAPLWRIFLEYEKKWPATVPRDVTYDLLGRLNFEEGDLFSAVFFFSKAADQAPQNWRYHFSAGLADWLRGGSRIYDAMKALKRAHELQPNNPDVLSLYAWTMTGVQQRWAQDEGPDRFRDAIRITDRAIAVDPSNYENYELRGLIHANLEAYPDAIRMLRRAVDLAPRAAGPRYHLAKVLLILEDRAATAEAEQHLIRAVADAPNFWMTAKDAPHIDLLVALLIRSNRLNEAYAVLQWQKSRQRQGR